MANALERREAFLLALLAVQKWRIETGGYPDAEQFRALETEHDPWTRAEYLYDPDGPALSAKVDTTQRDTLYYSFRSGR
jgi:hypothetical protein